MKVEIHTVKSRHIKVETDVDWLKKAKVGGVVIWPRILFSDPPDKILTWLFRHELEHAYQILREGPIKFYLKYFFYSLRYGYRNNPFEVEARQHQNDTLTTTEEQLLWKLKDV